MVSSAHSLVTGNGSTVAPSAPGDPTILISAIYDETRLQQSAEYVHASRLDISLIPHVPLSCCMCVIIRFHLRFDLCTRSPLNCLLSLQLILNSQLNRNTISSSASPVTRRLCGREVLLIFRFSGANFGSGAGARGSGNSFQCLTFSRSPANHLLALITDCRAESCVKRGQRWCCSLAAALQPCDA